MTQILTEGPIDASCVSTRLTPPVSNACGYSYLGSSRLVEALHRSCKHITNSNRMLTNQIVGQQMCVNHKYEWAFIPATVGDIMCQCLIEMSYCGGNLCSMIPYMIMMGNKNGETHEAYHLPLSVS